MMVMTAKVDKKKIAIVLAAVIVAIAGIVMLFGGDEDTISTIAGQVSNNDQRVAFLQGFGWDVTTSPVESSHVRIPSKTSEVFDRYNALQKSQGYDLSSYAGKTATRYVYKINNYPGTTEPVYATLLVYKNQVIGGDVTDTSAKGVIRGFQMPEKPVTPTQPSLPTDPTQATPSGYFPK